MERWTGARWVALAVAVLAVAGCGNVPAEPLVTRAGVSVADLPPGLLDELADRTAGALPAVAAALPAADAEAIVRQGRPGSPWSPDAVGRGAVGVPVPVEVPPTTAPLDLATGAEASLPMELVPAAGGVSGQRVLDAVRPVLDATPPPAALAPFVRVELPEYVSTLTMAGQDPTTQAADTLRQLGPEVIPWVTEVAGALAGHDRVVPLLRVGPGTEQEIVTAHGRAHLALALVVAGIVVSAADVPIVGTGPEVVVGAALDAGDQVLRARPMPDGHAAAEVERRRAEYRPSWATHVVTASGHRFGLVEGALPPTGEPANGLVTVVPGGLVVRTGAESGPVSVAVRVLPGPPEDDESGRRELATWHDVVEVAYTADAGWASLVGAAGTELPELTPPQPGSMRARVSARGRDDGDGERYEIAVWAAPPAPEVVLKATDRLGHRLRGQPEPPVVVRPESAYRWLRDSTLTVGATVTVVTGSSAEQVVAAFGGDPARPVPLTDDLYSDLEPWVAVLPVDGAVLAVEWNGWQGSRDEVLRAASARGRAASSYWSTDGGTSLAFARDGEVVHAFDPLFFEESPDAEAAAALGGIDWVDYTDLSEKTLVAVERFTGRGIGPRDVERIEAAAVAYRIPEGR